MRRSKAISVALTGLVFLQWASSVRAEQPPYRVYVVRPAINNAAILAGRPLPAVCRDEKVMKVMACRGEYEPASFVVVTDKALESVRIELDPPSGAAGALPNGAVDVRIAKPWTIGNFIQDILPPPVVLLKDGSLLVSKPSPTKKYPNRRKMTAPHGLQDAEKLLPARIDDRMQFWVTVHVPHDAQPGPYRGRVRIIPKNAPPTELALEVTVYPFRLLPPMLEYSIYYPTGLAAPGAQDWRTERWTNTAWITPKQFLLECRNMLAHGLSNPNIYDGPMLGAGGKLDFGKLERNLALREEAGMVSGDPLYLVGTPFTLRARPLSNQEKKEIIGIVKEVMAWGRRRGYPEIYFAAIDEAKGNTLAGERDTFKAVHDGGGKVFVACGVDFYDLVGDVLDMPVLYGGIQDALDVVSARLSGDRRYAPVERKQRPQLLAQLTNQYEKLVTFNHTRGLSYRLMIDGTHRRGNRIYTYGFPRAGLHLPQMQRRAGGLGLWQSGFDGSMTWAYTHISRGKKPVDQVLSEAYVLRGEDGVMDTLHWEGLREGVDDVRYLTTLLDLLGRAAGTHGRDPLVAGTWTWLTGLDATTADLNAIRAEMARRITALGGLGGPDSVLAGIDVDKVQIVTFPEPWLFKLDHDNRGVKQRWFAPDMDVSDWKPIRTDLNKGWDGQGFANPVPGYGWYGARLPLSEGQLRTKFVYLYFEAADEDAYVYLSGRKIFEQSVESTGLRASELWTTPFSVPLHPHLNRQGQDMLVVLVRNKQGGMGGLWKQVHVVLSDRQLSPEQLNALFQIRKTGRSN